jgi:hypothetical protein
LKTDAIGAILLDFDAVDTGDRIILTEAALSGRNLQFSVGDISYPTTALLRKENLGPTTLFGINL